MLSAKLFGRLTLNPIVHFDPIGAAFLVITAITGSGLGWAKPTPVNPANLRYGSVGDAIVSFAGPASNLVLAVVAALPLRLIIHSNLITQVPPFAQAVLLNFIFINCALFLFNLIPIPPLDGSKILLAALDPRTAYQLRPVLSQYGPILLLVVIFTGIASRVIGPLIEGIVRLLLGL